MSNYSYNRTVETYLRGNWSTTPIFVKNIPETDKPAAGFIRLSPENEPSFHASVGPNSFHRFPMSVVISVMAPVNNGWQTSMLWADTLAGLFRDSDAMSGLRFAQVDFITRGETDNYYRVDVIANGYFDILPSGTLVRSDLLLLENGSFFLLESGSGDRLLLE